MRDHHRYEFVPAIVVRRSGRDTFQMPRQMHRYGAMELPLRLRRALPPLDRLRSLGRDGRLVVAAVRLRRPSLALAIVPFSVAEAIYVVVAKRPRPVIAALTVPSWLTKNVAWSLGVLAGAAKLAVEPETRRRLRATRTPN